MRLLQLILRVLFLSAIAYPVAAQEFAPVLLEPLPQMAAPVLLPEIELPPAVADQTSTPQAAPFVGDATAPNYWIVSSRCSSQSFAEACCGPWQLDVFQRTPDCQLHRSSLAAMGAQLVPGIPVCLFSHGSFVEWESQCRQAHAFYLRMRQSCRGPLQMIFFTWPSEEHSKLALPFEVTMRGRQADFNGFYLTSLISHIPCACPICMVGHSHGARVILTAMHLAGGGAIEGYTSPCYLGNRRFRVVLAAAAMDHHWLNPGQLFGCALNRVECLLVFRNRQDLPLSLYPLSRLTARRALARAGVTQRDLEKIGWNSVKIRQCDVTELLGHGHYWPNYYEQPGILGNMIPYVYFQ